MDDARGPDDLQHFEDRVLYHLVDLAGTDKPLPINAMVPETALAERLSPDGLPTGDGSPADFRGVLTEALQDLERHGYADVHMVMGPWSARPTRAGRERVLGWRRRWQVNRDRQVQQAILTALDSQRRVHPERHTVEARVDVPALIEELGITSQEYLANAALLRDQGKIAEHGLDQMTLADGWAHITDSGVAALHRPDPSAVARGGDAERAWNEVARLRRQLALLGQEPVALIRDHELAQRCGDLLDAGAHFDRVIREASTILEDRVRERTGLDVHTGVPLMEKAFSAKTPMVRLSDDEREQRGAMEIYAGVMRLFRNAAGHRLSAGVTQERALQFVVMVDLLLALVGEAQVTPRAG